MPASRADLLTQAKYPLFKSLGNSVGRDGITESEIVELTGLVTQAAKAAEPRLARISHTFPQYTEHDLGHSLNLIELIGKLLPAATLEKLNALEIALGMLAAILHDGGMFVSDEEKQKILAGEEYKEYLLHNADRVAAADAAREEGQFVRAQAIETAVLAEFVRRLHASRVRQFIESMPDLRKSLKFRETDLFDMLADLCESHAWPVRSEGESRRGVDSLKSEWLVNSVPVNLQYLACLLRLADILDFDRSRTPLSVYQDLNFTETKSWEEWNKHLQVTGWKVTADHVRYQTACTRPAFYVAVHEFLDWIDVELREVAYLLADAPKSVPEHYTFELPQAVDRRGVEMKDKKYITGGFRFTLDYERIMKLLMDKSLYPDPSMFLRELLQNSLDACRLAEARAKESKTSGAYEPNIVVWDHSEDKDDPRLIFQDNGVGMSRRIVEDYFMRVGRSFYRSREFEAERAKLAKLKINLEACSQFGIGILSCFMVADQFEVETYRFNEEPLKITIEGPGKYFVIERLKKPAPAQFQSPPESDEEDGPPRRPGTRITLRLRKGTKLDVNGTLKQFAVNIDYDVRSYRPSGRSR